MRGMCERKPDVCKTGGAALHTIGVRAREAARIGYELLGDDAPTELDETVKTGTVPSGEAKADKAAPKKG
jgi:hypothetical protein